MSDLKDLQKIAKKFIDDRDWRKFQTLKDLSMNASVESAELMEIFLWKDKKFEEEITNHGNRKIEDKIKNEVSDILFSCLAIADQMNFDLEEAYKNKMDELNKRYDVNKVKGKIIKINSPDNSQNR